MQKFEKQGSFLPAVSEKNSFRNLMVEERRGPFEIRLATLKDAKAIVKVYSETYPKKDYPFYSVYSVEGIKKWILDPRIKLFVALIGKEVVGVAALLLEGNSGELGRAAVRPDFRGLKVGSELLKARILTASKLGLDKLFSEARGAVHETLSNLFKKGGLICGVSIGKYCFGNSEVDYRESIVLYLFNIGTKTSRNPWLSESTHYLSPLLNPNYEKEDSKRGYSCKIYSYLTGGRKEEWHYVSATASPRNKKDLYNLLKKVDKYIAKLRNEGKRVNLVEIKLEPANKKSIPLQEELVKKGWIPTAAVPGTPASVVFSKLYCSNNEVPIKPLSIPDIIPQEIRDVLYYIELSMFSNS